MLVQFGQRRTRGLISKTMGVVAGGPFESKVEVVVSHKARGSTTIASVADAIAPAAAKPTSRWGLQLVSRVNLPGQDPALLELSGDRVEARAFAILGAGGDPTRKAYACPGIDHAAAFSIELVVVHEGEEIRVLLIDEMFRMKIYFEDAGPLKFAANMQMPGSIEDELRDLVEEAL